MPSVQRLYALFAFGILSFLPLNSLAATSTFTPTRTHSNTPTTTPTRTPSGTPTDTGTPTFSLTPNPTLTPPCGALSGTFGDKSSTGTAASGSSTNSMRASMFNLAKPATVSSLWLYCPLQDNGIEVMTGVYSGSAGNIGSLLVSASPQTAIVGWNGFPITPTFFPAGNYWLAYAYNSSNPWIISNNSAAVSALAYTNGLVSFGAMPGTMPATISYATLEDDPIYAVYCDAPTSTPTPSNTPTNSFTPTLSPTFTITQTPTNTGTIFTNTPTLTFTLSPTPTSTLTNTYTLSPTPNASLTPDCGAGAVSFGDPNTFGGPVTAFSSYAFRACRYTLNQSGTVETMSLYLPPQDAGLFYVEPAIYSNDQSSTVVGNLLAQATTYQISAPGWNTFKIPNTPVTAGDYWLAYIYSGAATWTFALDYQSSPPPGNAAVSNTACNFGPPPTGFTFPSTGSFVPTSPPPPTPGSFYNNSFYEPIVANFCPGTANSPTPTNTPTVTSTATITNTPTITYSPTDTGTSTFTGTPTLSPTVTATGTPTDSPTATSTLTLSPTSTQTSTPTDSPTWTTTFTPSDSPTDSMTPTASFTATPSATPTNTQTPTLTGTPTYTATVTSTFTITDTPNLTLTATSTPTSTGTSSFTGTPSSTGTDTPTSTASSTPISTGTSTYTGTFTPSFTATASLTLSPTATFSATGTPTFTPTYSATATPTLTYSTTATVTSTASGSPTVTPTLSAATTPILYPNPFKGPGPVHLVLVFDQPHDYVTVRIFTTAFRKVYEDTNAFVPAGNFDLDIDPDRFKGSSAANGLYYVITTTPSNHWISKLLILK